MALYRKKTLTEASRYQPGMEDGWSLIWPSGAIFAHDLFSTRADAQAKFDAMFRDPETPHTGEAEPEVVPVLRSLEGLHMITDGDYIATGPKGERYSIKGDIFAATYELPPAREPDAVAKLICRATGPEGVGSGHGVWGDLSAASRDTFRILAKFVEQEIFGSTQIGTR